MRAALDAAPIVLARSLPQPIARACFAESVRLFAELGMPHERARSIEALARYEVAHGDPLRGATLARELSVVFARLGIVGAPRISEQATA